MRENMLQLHLSRPLRTRQSQLPVVVLLTIALLFLFGPAQHARAAASFVVNSEGDQPDTDPGDGKCQIIKRGQCTLRAAIEEANALSGHDTITFNGSTTNIQPATNLPALTDDDGATIYGAGNVTLDGSLVQGGDMPNRKGIQIINSRQNKIQGLIIRDFFWGILVRGGLFDVASNNIIGTDSNGQNDTQERNVIRNNGEGIRLEGIGSHHNVIAGNYIGTNSAGTSAQSNSMGIVVIFGAGYNRIGTDGDGNADAAERNVISGNKYYGIELAKAGYATIAGNIIGLDASGTQALGNGRGINLNESSLNRIGTDGNGVGDAAERNIISSNTDEAIQLGYTSDTVIAGNYIGTRENGTGDRGNGRGIVIFSSSNNLIGGNLATEGNIIAYSEIWGIMLFNLAPDPVNNSFLRNSIFENGEGITLYPGGGANDPGDGDSGPNNLVNFPVLTSAVNGGGVTLVTGQIVSGLPNTTFQVQIFSSPSCHATGSGEGRTYHATQNVTTSASGNATFTFTISPNVPAGDAVTATATDSDGNTSQFSQCVTAN
jgi:CSLREA domain-containing protein